MGKNSIIVVITALLGWALSFSVSAQTASPEDIRNWVESLADPSFQVREKAERNLWEAGQLAEKFVADATRHEHPEVRMRSSRIYRRFERGIFPDTPAPLRKQIEAYSAKPNAAILKSLISEGRILTVLRLIRAADGKHASYLTNSSSIPKVEEYLIEADEPKREQFYRLYGDFPKMARHYALYHGLRGTAREELNDLQRTAGDDNWEKRYFLLRAVGEPEKAKKLAVEKGDNDLASQVDIVNGSLEVFLKQRATEYSPGNIHHHCYRLALASLQRDRETTAEESQEILDLAGKDEKLGPHAAEVFATTGQIDFAYRVLESPAFSETRRAFLLAQGDLMAALEEAGVDTARPLLHSLEKLDPETEEDRKNLVFIGNIVSRFDCMDSRRYIYGKLFEFAKKRNDSRLLTALGPRRQGDGTERYADRVSQVFDSTPKEDGSRTLS